MACGENPPWRSWVTKGGFINEGHGLHERANIPLDGMAGWLHDRLAGRLHFAKRANPNAVKVWAVPHPATLNQNWK